jgi:hypothetical protein
MTYTFWHSGILIGESDLREAPGNPRQLGGVFLPTAYGLEVFPRISGFLSAGHALKTHIEANGRSTDELQPGDIADLLDTTPAGQKIIAIGRVLSEVEMRAPDGVRLEFASIAFSDVLEVQRLARELALSTADRLADLPPDAPRYIVTATFRAGAAASRREPLGGYTRRRHWPADN